MVTDYAVLHRIHRGGGTAKVVYPVGVEGLIYTHIELTLLDAILLQLGIGMIHQFIERKAGSYVEGMYRTVEVVIVQIDGIRPVFWTAFSLEVFRYVIV